MPLDILALLQRQFEIHIVRKQFEDIFGNFRDAVPS